MNQDSVIFSGTAHPQLAKQIASNLNEQLGNITVSQFSDDETHVVINESIRGKDVYIIQPTCTPCNHNLMELLIIIDAAKRCGPKTITAVIPYFGYARQDRKVGFSRVPITSALAANLLESAGVDLVLTMDLHAQQIHGFFNKQIIDITAKSLFINDIQKRFNKNILIVSPDVGGVGRARHIAKNLHCGDTDLAIVEKRRPKANESEVMNVIGNVEGRICIMIDDIVDTAGTLCKAAQALLDRGALEVHAYCTHAVLSGNAVSNIENSQLKSLAFADTIPVIYESPKLRHLSSAKLFAETIARLRDNDSVSQMYTD
jgi:ribose-phosphate pyrophosphokinase